MTKIMSPSSEISASRKLDGLDRQPWLNDVLIKRLFLTANFPFFAERKKGASDIQTLTEVQDIYGKYVYIGEL